MKVGDLVKMTRKKWQASGTNSYLGIFIEEKWDEWFVEVLGGKRSMGRFSPSFWEYEVISENR